MLLYVSSVFAPALDEVVGNLWRVSYVFLGGSDRSNQIPFLVQRCILD